MERCLPSGGNTVRVYSTERTLCDILRPDSRVDIHIVTEAFKRYAARSNKNFPALSEYAKILKVETNSGLARSAFMKNAIPDPLERL